MDGVGGRRGGFRRGLVAGALAGAATAGAMELAAAVAGLRTLPELLAQPLLAVLPGAVFGLLIDTLQHAGKVLEEAGLLLAMIVALALLGGLHGLLLERRPVRYLALAAAAVAWAAICLVLLPAGGAGWLGLGDGLTTPLLWAVVCGVYMLVLEMAHGPALPPAPDPGRRRAMRALPVAAALAGLGVAGLRLGPGWYRAVFAAPETRHGAQAAELTPVSRFYVVSKNLSDPVVDGATWSLNVHGLVEAPFRLSLAGLRGLPATTFPATLMCISNNVGGDLISTGRFTGVPLRDLLARAQPRPAARWVSFRGRDGFTESIPLDAVTENVLVAHALEGAPLPGAHGFPARVLIPGRYGMKQPKWLDDIELTAAEAAGYWESQGWDRVAAVKPTARIDTPVEGEIVPRGPLTVAGIAFAGVRGISRVEVSTDGGRTWSDADLRPPLGPLTWTLWSHSWNPGQEGAHTLVARATTAGGTVQTSAVRPSFPDGASGYHRVRVNVAR